MSKSIQIFGFHSIESVIDSYPERVLNIYVQSDRRDKRMRNILEKLHKQKIAYCSIDKYQLEKLTKGESHQGIVAEVNVSIFQGQHEFIKYIKNSSDKPIILILDSIQDPRNFGACLRNANASGVDCVVFNKDGSSPINALVHKASAGAINQIKLFQVTNLSRTIKELQKNNVWIIGLDSKSNKSLYQVDLSDSVALVIGGEDKGLRRLIKESCDEIVNIPMTGTVESLNVSVATGIALFESIRQRQTD